MSPSTNNNNSVQKLAVEVEGIKKELAGQVQIHARLDTAIDKLNTHEVSITGTGKPKIGAHGKPVVFLHPKSCNGTLIELEEV